MQKYIPLANHDNSVDLEIPGEGWSLDDAVYKCSDVDALVQTLRGALADIAFADDLDETGRRNKAKRIYEQTADADSSLMERKP